MPDLSYGTTGFEDRDLEAAFDAIVAAGFKQTEILGQEPHLCEPPTGGALTAFGKRLEARGLRIRTVHAPLKKHMLGAPDEDWRRGNVDVFSEYLCFAGAVGATDVVIHTAPNPKSIPMAEDPQLPGRIRDAVRRSLDELVPIAGQVGTRILVENLPFRCAFPFMSMGELRPLVEDYPAAQLGLVLDTGHAWTARLDPADQIRRAGSRLGGTHLQDVDLEAPDDQHWAPTQGDLDWESILAALGEVQYNGPWTFEVCNPRHGETPDELARLVRDVADQWAR